MDDGGSPSSKRATFSPGRADHGGGAGRGDASPPLRSALRRTSMFPEPIARSFEEGAATAGGAHRRASGFVPSLRLRDGAGFGGVGGPDTLRGRGGRVSARSRALPPEVLVFLRYLIDTVPRPLAGLAAELCTLMIQERHADWGVGGRQTVAALQKELRRVFGGAGFPGASGFGNALPLAMALPEALRVGLGRGTGPPPSTLLICPQAVVAIEEEASPGRDPLADFAPLPVAVDAGGGAEPVVAFVDLFRRSVDECVPATRVTGEALPFDFAAAYAQAATDHLRAVYLPKHFSGEPQTSATSGGAAAAGAGLHASPAPPAVPPAASALRLLKKTAAGQVPVASSFVNLIKRREDTAIFQAHEAPDGEAAAYLQIVLSAHENDTANYHCAEWASTWEVCIPGRLLAGATGGSDGARPPGGGGGPAPRLIIVGRIAASALSYEEGTARLQAAKEVAPTHIAVPSALRSAPAAVMAQVIFPFIERQEARVQRELAENFLSLESAVLPSMSRSWLSAGQGFDWSSLTRSIAEKVLAPRDGPLDEAVRKGKA